MTSSFDVNRSPLNHFFKFGNKKSHWGPNLENTVDDVIIRILIPSFWSSKLLRFAPVHCLDRRGTFSYSNEAVFSWFLHSTGAITTHNTLQLSFVVFGSKSNRCRWSRVYPKKLWSSPCRPISPSSPSLEPIRLQEPTVLTVPLCVVEYPCFVDSYVLTQKLVRIATQMCQNSLRIARTITFILLWEKTRHPSCRDFFHIQFFVQNWKHCTLRYVCGLNYFAHFHSSITQNHIVDFVNHFGDSHFYWTFRTMFIFCGCTATFKLIYPIVNSCKHRSRCAMNFIQLSFDLLRYQVF